MRLGRGIGPREDGLVEFYICRGDDFADVADEDVECVGCVDGAAEVDAGVSSRGVVGFPYVGGVERGDG